MAMQERNWAFVIFNNISFAVSLRPLNSCSSNLINILQDHFTTVVYNFCLLLGGGGGGGGGGSSGLNSQNG